MALLASPCYTNNLTHDVIGVCAGEGPSSERAKLLRRAGMITVYGTPGSEEYRAAQQLRDLILQEWTDADVDPRTDIRLIPNAKTYGEKRQDIDLIAIGKLGKPREVLDGKGAATGYSILSFAWAIEIKGHPAHKVRFEGPKVFVSYEKGKHEDASEQAEDEKWSVLEYLRRHGARGVHCLSFVWLSNIPAALLPKLVSNTVGSDTTWRQWLLKVLQLERAYLAQRKAVLINAIDQRNAVDIMRATEVFVKPLEATPLNRRKIELITQGVLGKQKYVEGLQKELLVFRGRGGTGKTVYLLQLAYDLYRERSAKVLLLTYNVALVADIRRLLALMGISHAFQPPTIKVASIHTYLYETLTDLGLSVGPATFLSDFEKLKQEALALEAIKDGDIEHWDFVLIDEAQDWPADERDLLFKIFGPERIILADGLDQLVRGSRPLDWRVKTGVTKTRVVPLNRSLRLKANICTFVNAFARCLNIAGWQLNVNNEIHGGRVVLCSGPLERAKQFVFDLIEANRKAGNAPIDMLMCTPPSQNRPQCEKDLGTAETTVELSLLGTTLTEWGLKVWDATNNDVRRSFPTDINDLRIVQYDSCRGLEGWTVMNWQFENLFDYKLRTFDPNSTDRDLFVSTEDAATGFANSWLMIPLTRAIDTLVLHVTDRRHPLWAVLLDASDKLDGLVDIVDLEKTP